MEREGGDWREGEGKGGERIEMGGGSSEGAPYLKILAIPLTAMAAVP